MSEDATRVLVVDDDRGLLRALATLLRRVGFEVTTTADGAQTLPLARSFDPDVILLDLRMPPPDGMTVLRELKANAPSHEVIIVTAEGGVPLVVEAIKLGAYWFLEKPFDNQSLLGLIRRAAERRFLAKRIEGLESATRLVGSSAPMRRLQALIRKIADDPVTVLITGESGTGKEMVAREIHVQSSRKDHGFEAINCGAIPENLIESELFGHTKGAFTGAVRDKIGLFERADGGTVLLDEIGDLPLPAQVKLLRVLQEREVRRVGGTRATPVDVRVIAASKFRLAELVEQKRFREDLYYRLNVFPIKLPPLRDRREDIPLLANHFLEKCLARAGRRRKRVERFTPEAMDLLQRHDFRGNVRELENLVERAVVVCDAPEITPEFLPEELRLTEPGAGAAGRGRDLSRLDWRQFREEYLPGEYRRWLRSLLEHFEGNRARAARAVGMDRANLRKLLTKYGVD